MSCKRELVDVLTFSTYFRASPKSGPNSQGGVLKWLNIDRRKSYLSFKKRSNRFQRFFTKWEHRSSHFLPWFGSFPSVYLVVRALADWICFILHIMIVLIVLDHLTTSNYLTWQQNYKKWGQFCRKKGENLHFRLFSSLSAWICLIMQIMIVLMVLFIWQPQITWFEGKIMQK